MSDYKKNGIWYNKLHRVISPRLLTEQGTHFDATTQQEAYSEYAAASVKRFAEAQNNLSVEAQAEQAYERRAAFGEGTEVIDVITGKRYTS